MYWQVSRPRVGILIHRTLVFARNQSPNFTLTYQYMLSAIEPNVHRVFFRLASVSNEEYRVEPHKRSHLENRFFQNTGFLAPSPSFLSVEIDGDFFGKAARERSFPVLDIVGKLHGGGIEQFSPLQPDHAMIAD